MNTDTKTLEQRARERLISLGLAIRDHNLPVPGHKADFIEAIEVACAALSSAAEAKGMGYDRQAIVRMLDAVSDGVMYDEGNPTFDGILDQITLLCAVDEADAAGVRTVAKKVEAVAERVNKFGEPEVIYLQLHGDGYKLDTKPDSYKKGEVTWCWHAIYEDDVRYIRADLATPPAASAVPPQYERAYIIANHFDSTKGGLPDEWQDWAEEISRDLRSLASSPSPETEGKA